MLGVLAGEKIRLCVTPVSIVKQLIIILLMWATFALFSFASPPVPLISSALWTPLAPNHVNNFHRCVVVTSPYPLEQKSLFFCLFGFCLFFFQLKYLAQCCSCCAFDGRSRLRPRWRRRSVQQDLLCAHPADSGSEQQQFAPHVATQIPRARVASSTSSWHLIVFSRGRGAGFGARNSFNTWTRTWSDHGEKRCN